MHTETRDGVLAITFDRPDVLNAFTVDTAVDLADAVSEANVDDHDAVVLTGEGKAFSAGGDIQSMAEREETVRDAYDRVEASFGRVVEEIMESRVPVVAKVNGDAVGAGLAVAAVCDFAYAAESARFSCAFVRVTEGVRAFERHADGVAGRVEDAPEDVVADDGPGDSGFAVPVAERVHEQAGVDEFVDDAGMLAETPVLVTVAPRRVEVADAVVGVECFRETWAGAGEPEEGVAVAPELGWPGVRDAAGLAGRVCERTVVAVNAELHDEALLDHVLYVRPVVFKPRV